MPAHSPPVETGQRLATLDRGPDEEIRINWSSLQRKPVPEHPALVAGSEDRPLVAGFEKRGLSIRIRELGQLAAAVDMAIDRAEEIRAAWTTLPPDHPARRSARRRPGPNCTQSQTG